MQLKEKRAAITLLIIVFVFLMYAMESYPEWAGFVFIIMAVIVLVIALLQWFA